MTERKLLIAKKRHIQSVKNALKQFDGISVSKFFFENENVFLNELYMEYSPMMRSCLTHPYSRMSNESYESQIILWIIETMKLRENEDYFYYRSGTWVKIQILDLQRGVKSLWDNAQGFLIVNSDLTCIMEACNDSRDEDNYLIDIYYTEQRDAK